MFFVDHRVAFERLELKVDLPTGSASDQEGVAGVLDVDDRDVYVVRIACKRPETLEEFIGFVDPS